MKSSWKNTWSDFKSPLRVVVQCLLRRRRAWQDKCRRYQQERDEARRGLAECQAKRARSLETIRDQEGVIRRQQTQSRIEAAAPIRLPADPPIGRHGYGARMVSLMVNLAQVVGFRGAERVLTIVCEAWRIDAAVPDWTTIRTWMQRLGVADLNQTLDPDQEVVWLADHSNQIGAEKALVVLAVPVDRLPPPGQALTHGDVKVLTVRPGATWKREDVAAVYAELAERHGAPRAVLCDGAVELREGAECLKTRRADSIVIHDFKHKAANFLKATLDQDERFAEFQTQIGKTRSAIQQTELGHLTPPTPKQKARFMNLGGMLNWAAMALWTLDHPEAQARRSVTNKRLEEKLGWLRADAADLAGWRQCQEVVEKGVTFANEQGLFDGAARRLHAELVLGTTHSAARRLAKQLVHFVYAAEGRLRPGERLPMSTEILESCFGLYKQLEKQHSKGGFTSLLAAFPALLQRTTPESIRRAFQQVKVRDVREWVQTNLGQTLTAKRQAAYKEFKTDRQRATELVGAT